MAVKLTEAQKRAEAEAAVLAKIAAMPEPWRPMAERIHTAILAAAPGLEAATWYGMPGYKKDGKPICFFRADKQYMTFGFTQDAGLAAEPGASHQLISSGWFLTALDEATEAEIGILVRKAVR